jgi:rhodanese-related sulfurtransferase
MAKTFMQMANEAMAQVPGITAAELRRRMRGDGRLLVVDVRDEAEVRATGRIPGSIGVSLGMLPVRADRELPADWREPALQDRSRPVVTVCSLGPNSARGAALLKEMGFTDVAYLSGGIHAWSEAGLPTESWATPTARATSA